MKVLIVSVLLFIEVFTIPLDTNPEIQNWVIIPDQDATIKLSMSMAITNVDFILSTNSSSNQTVELGDSASLAASGFDPKNPTRFIIHGWNNNATSPVNQLISSAYHSKGNFNVFIVDWGKGASYTYGVSAVLVIPVGNTIAQFIGFLRNETGLNMSDITLVGHSLGAHIAGHAGKRVEGNEKIGVIVGLDPAGPIFSTALPSHRLNSEDADYVETIHTNACLLGYCKSLGKASFFPNYGSKQLGCGTDLLGTCAHSRSYHYFAESIVDDKGFPARQCRGGYTDVFFKICRSTGEYSFMGGEPIFVKSEGVYWLKTNDKPPYATGKIN